MRKFMYFLLVITLVSLPMTGLAESPAVQLPMGVAFGMTLDEVAKAVGEGAMVEDWGEGNGSGSVFVEDVPLGIGSIQTGFISFGVTCNNSQKEPRLDNISLSLAYDGNCIAAFRSAVADLTAVYGQPDSDPFDEYARESYQEYGNLSASWTLPDTRIYLSLNQAYTENGSIDLSYAYRLCYDLSDLDE